MRRKKMLCGRNGLRTWNVCKMLALDLVQWGEKCIPPDVGERDKLSHILFFFMSSVSLMLEIHRSRRSHYLPTARSK